MAAQQDNNTNEVIYYTLSRFQQILKLSYGLSLLRNLTLCIGDRVGVFTPKRQKKVRVKFSLLEILETDGKNGQRAAQNFFFRKAFVDHNFTFGQHLALVALINWVITLKYISKLVMIKSYLWKNIKLFATGHQY